MGAGFACVAPLPLLVVEPLVDVIVVAAVVEAAEVVEVVALVEADLEAGVEPPVKLMETCLGEPELSSMSTVTLHAIPAKANQASTPPRNLILMHADVEQPRRRTNIARNEVPRGAMRENLRSVARPAAQPLGQFFCCGLRFGVLTSVDSSTPERTSILMPSLMPNATSRCSKRFGPVTTSTKGLSASN